MPPLIFGPNELGKSFSILQSDAGILESVIDDGIESFLYGFAGGTIHRFLGERVRGDDGKTADYKGPWYDVVFAGGPARSQPGNPNRLKFFYFDNDTKFPARTDYILPDTRKISTEFRNWTRIGGQSFPGQIVRSENDVVVFTFTIVQASFAAAADYGIFGAQ